MANIHGLYSNKNDDSDDDDSRENRYVGGVDARGGGSGLAVEPSPDDNDNHNMPAGVDDVFQLASHATDAERLHAASRRTITMYRNGFVVDDGPYRRLDDAQNAEFLKSLAMGRTPRELLQDDQDVVVNLIDKRTQDYVETFRSFSGTGTSLGVRRTNATNGIIDPSTLPSPPPPPTTTTAKEEPTTSIQVKLLNSKRRVIKLHLTATVGTLAAMLEATEPFSLVTGFPPTTLTDMNATIQEAGLQGAQVMMQKV